MSVFRRHYGVAVTAIAVMLVAGCGAAADKPAVVDPNEIRIGLLSTLAGPFTPLGVAANQGAKLALIEAGGSLAGPGPLDTVRGAKVANKSVRLFIESSDATSSTLKVARAMGRRKQGKIRVAESH